MSSKKGKERPTGFWPLLKKLEKPKTDVLLYATSTRDGAPGLMDESQVPVIYRQIHALNPDRDKDRTLVMILHTHGGSGTTPWRIISMVREYYGTFEVMIPYCAYSAGTLIALGADKIVMHPVAVLGPTDPTVGNEFNPTNPQGQPIGISVEDVSAYINLIKDDVGIRHEDELVEAFKVLVDKVHPLALGNVKRQTQQARILAQRIIELRAEHIDEHSVSELVQGFTSRMFFHGHPISQREAKQYLNLTTIGDPTEDEIKVLTDLYDELAKTFVLEEEFMPPDMFLKEHPDVQVGEWKETAENSLFTCQIESRIKCARHEVKYQLVGTRQQDQSVVVNWKRTAGGWSYYE